MVDDLAGAFGGWLWDRVEPLLGGAVTVFFILLGLALILGGKRTAHRLTDRILRLVFGFVGGLFGVIFGALRLGLTATAPLAISAVLGSSRPRKVADPTSTPLVERVKIDPARPPGLENLGHGHHYTPAGVVRGNHKVTIGRTESAKGQTDVNWEMQHQLQRGVEHLVIVDAKPEGDLTDVAKAYMRPEDRFFSYTFHADDPKSSALRLFADTGQLGHLTRMLCEDPDSKDARWGRKAGAVAAAVAMALSGLPNGKQGPITASINDVRDVIADRARLEALRKRAPVLDNSVDVPKEWGYIRSEAVDRFDALSDPAVRRVFAADRYTEQPDFGPSEDGGRTVVIVRPHPDSAEMLRTYVHTVLDVVYRLAAAGGGAGGPGTKVIVDEAASYMRLDNLGKYLDLGRTSLVQLHYVLQGYHQLETRVGPSKARHLFASTEVKVVGATSDEEAAAKISRLSGKVRVNYRGPRRDGKIFGDWRETERWAITEGEILAQKEGEWTVQHDGNVTEKCAVERAHYHHRQAAQPVDHPVRGVVPGDHTPPPLTGGQTPEPVSGTRREPQEETQASRQPGRGTDGDGIEWLE